MIISECSTSRASRVSLSSPSIDHRVLVCGVQTHRNVKRNAHAWLRKMRKAPGMRSGAIRIANRRVVSRARVCGVLATADFAVMHARTAVLTRTQTHTQTHAHSHMHTHACPSRAHYAIVSARGNEELGAVMNGRHRPRLKGHTAESYHVPYSRARCIVAITTEERCRNMPFAVIIFAPRARRGNT